MFRAPLLRMGFLAISLLLAAVLFTRAAEAQPFIYVTNQASDDVSIIDGATNTVVDTVVVGDRPFGVAFSPDSTRAYVTNSFSSELSVIDTSTRTVIDTIALPGALDVEVTPDGARAFVTGGGRVIGIDTATNTVVGTPLFLGGPTQLAITPDGTRAYVTVVGTNRVAVIDTTSITEVDSIAMTNLSIAITIDEAGTRAYVTQPTNNLVRIIDVGTNILLPGTLAPFTTPSDVALTPDGSRAYVPAGSFTLAYDTSTNLLGAIVPMSSGLQRHRDYGRRGARLRDEHEH